MCVCAIIAFMFLSVWCWECAQYTKMIDNTMDPKQQHRTQLLINCNTRKQHSATNKISLLKRKLYVLNWDNRF